MSDDVPRGLKLLQIFWPIGLAFLVGGASIVQAGSQVEQVERRVTEIETNGSPVVRERLARIEEAQKAQGRQLDRIETLVGDLDKRTRERNLRGL